MMRVCFQLQVEPELVPAYRERHRAVWPRMLREIHASGRRNYSLFLRADGLLIGYYETESVLQGDRYLAASEIAAEWERHMGELFAGLEGRADQFAVELEEVFHLEDQLAVAEGSKSANRARPATAADGARPAAAEKGRMES